MVTINFMNAEETMREAAKRPRVECPSCHEKVAVKKDGTFYWHKKWEGTGYRPEPCEGSGKKA